MGRIEHLKLARGKLLCPTGALKKLLSSEWLWSDAVQLLLEIPEENWEELSVRIGRLGAAARKEAARLAAARRTERCRGYWAWSDDQLRTGAAALHGICRARLLEPDTAVPVTCPLGTAGWSLQPTQLLEKELGAWCQVWHRHAGAKAPWREGQGEPVGDPLPSLTPDLLREAARAFPAKKGFSGFNARWFLYLGDEALWGVCRFLEACERNGLWPEAVRHAILHLIPKRGGGRRPIGLVDGLCRLWELARRPLVRRWRAEHTRKYDYGGRGRTSTDAVWLQALHDESAEVLGRASSTVLWDLCKAFESVPLGRVWARGLAEKFPVRGFTPGS